MKNLPSDIVFRHLRFDPEYLEGWEALLSRYEAERAHEFTGKKRRREFILGRAAARLLLSDELAVEPQAVPLSVAESGAIDVVGADLHVSIAHSGDHAVAAASSRMVGVDIESIVPRNTELRRFLVHPDEQELLESIPLDPNRSQILWWTLKEATLKAMRTGLRFPPRKIRLDVDLGEERARAYVEEGRDWDLFFEEWDGYYVAVAAEP